MAVTIISSPMAAQVYNGGGVGGGITQAGADLGGSGIQTGTDIGGMIVTVVNFILNFVLILAVASIVVAGVFLITSGGDEGQKDKAKRIVYYALIGIVVVLLSKSIVIVVNSLFP